MTAAAARIAAAMEATEIVAQIDTLITEFERVRSATPHDDFSGGMRDDEKHQVATRLRSAIERMAPPGSTYVTEAQEVRGHPGYLVQRLGGILKALREDVAAGFTELVHAAIFDDFLDMAAELLDKGYDAPAAVLAGSVLEEHVRQLAEKAAIKTTHDGRHRPFEALTVDLVKAGLFGEPQRKILAAWYGQRNEAAHGRPENLVSDQVAAMPDGIREFMTRHPA